jgi:hypothetical protein
MASKSSESIYYADGSFDWSGGVDSSKVTTLQSELNPNGLKRNQLSWLNNATIRSGGILQRTGWQPLVRLLDSGYWQGGYIYEPDSGYPYLVCQISGILYSVLLDPPYTTTDLTGGDPMLQNPSDPAIAEMAWFCQGENFLINQAGDYYNPGPVILGKTDSLGRTLPLFWNGISLRRSVGITSLSPYDANGKTIPGVNEIPAATCMDYYANRLWFAQARQYAAGDIVGGPSGTTGYRFRDAILNVTENPLCFRGDGFTVPTNAGNIRALKHSSNINESLGEGQFYIFTRKAVYSLSVPVNRLDWIHADADNGPKQTVVQLVNGAVGDRSVVPVNGDLYYQSFDPAIRSLKRAQQYFENPGNTAISQNEQRALQINDRALMRFSSGVQFDQRILNLVLPQLADDGQNIIHKAILPLDFDTVTNFEERQNPVWEGIYDGLDMIQLFEGDFGGLQRGFAVDISRTDGSINIWELTISNRRENGDSRIVWSPEFPAFTWAAAGLEHDLKQLVGGECWVDKIAGTVEIDVYYRVDAEPCWRRWLHTQICSERCEDADPVLTAYPCQPFREGYVFPIVFPEPQTGLCGDMQVRPPTIGYQFQVKIMLKGWCRIRGLLVLAMFKAKPQYQGIACPPNTKVGMAVLPTPFASTPAILTPASNPCDLSDLSPNTGTEGVAFSAQITGTGGTGFFNSFSLIAGSLPLGLTITTTGLISGTPSAAGSYDFSIQAIDSALTTCARNYTITISAAPVVVCDWASVLTQLTPVAGTASLQSAWNGIFTEVIDGDPGSPMWYFLTKSLFGLVAAPDEDPVFPCTPATWPACAGAGWAAAWMTGTQLYYLTGIWFLVIGTDVDTSWEGTFVTANSSDPSGIYDWVLGATLTVPQLKVTAVSGGYCVSLP